MGSPRSLDVFGKKYRLKRQKSLNKRHLDGELDFEVISDEIEEIIVDVLSKVAENNCSLSHKTVRKRSK